MPDTPYAIGSSRLPGLAKMAEECGELQQAIAKLMAVGGLPQYFDGTNCYERLREEMADVMAAIHFFVHANGVNDDVLVEMATKKMEQFTKWHGEQLEEPPKECTCAGAKREFWCPIHGG